MRAFIVFTSLIFWSYVFDKKNLSWTKKENRKKKTYITFNASSNWFLMKLIIKIKSDRRQLQISSFIYACRFFLRKCRSSELTERKQASCLPRHCRKDFETYFNCEFVIWVNMLQVLTWWWWDNMAFTYGDVILRVGGTHQSSDQCSFDLNPRSAAMPGTWFPVCVMF